MGNRAVIAFEGKPDAVGVYVHWNGGRASVEGFLMACKANGFRSPESDPSYALARLVQVITAFFGDGLSVGVGPLRSLDCDNYDNGVYIVGGDWEITGRRYNRGSEEVDPEKTAAIAGAITARLDALAAVEI